jgi:glycerol-1-phosphate dehydrogenase [NAD(P)+]
METREKNLGLEECIAAASDTKCLVVKEGALEEIPGLLNRYFAGGRVFLVADNNTFKAAGEAVLEIIRAAGIGDAGIYIFSDNWPHAEYGHVETLREALNKARAEPGGEAGIVPLAAGSGTINDLVKRAASELGLPYLCVPTAASVDGYTAYGAALLYEGFKQTLPCAAPLVVAADTSVLAGAPAFLGSSGFADLAGKLIAASDWIIADRVAAIDPSVPGAEAIDPKAWSMIQPSLRDTLEKSVPAAQGDRDAVKTLFEGLGITGLALQYMKNSRSVSGSEHMWSHVWEMQNLSARGIPVTHGHKVAVGTLAAAAFTETLFSEKPSLKAISHPRQSWAEREASIRAAFTGYDRAAGAALKTSREKFIDDPARAKKLAEGILDNWENIREAVSAKLPPYAELYAMLKKAGCPLKPEETGLTRERILSTARNAQMIRNRFTVLDLAYETGVFEDTLKRLESSGVYFRD